MKNLRTSGEGVIRLGRRPPQRISAQELSREQAAAFFSDAFPRFVAGQSPLQRSFSERLLREVLQDPDEGARSHPVFGTRALAEEAAGSRVPVPAGPHGLLPRRLIFGGGAPVIEFGPQAELVP